MKDPFWQTTPVLWRFKRQIAIGLAAALFTGVLYGVGFGLLLPLLKVLLDKHGSMAELIRTKLTNDGQWKSFVPLADRLASHVPPDRFHAFLWVAGALAVLTVIGGTTRYIHEMMTITISARAAQVWRGRAFNHLIRVPLSHTFKSGSADYISRLSVDTKVLADGYQAILGKVVAEVCKAAGAIAIALFINWKLAMAAVIAAPLMIILLRKFGKRISRATLAALNQRGKMLGALNESLGGLAVVKTHSAEGYERRRFSRINQILYAEEMKMRQAKALSSPLVEVLATLGFLALFTVAAWYIMVAAAVKPEDFITVLAALFGASQSVRPLAQLHNQLQESGAAATRVLEMLALPAEPIGIDDRQHLPRLQRHRASILFDKVSYQYPRQDRPAVDAVNLTIQHGQTIAIVGANGSGKTTLLSTLTRLLEPTRGRVLIDGVDIAGVNLRSLREQIAVVTQQTVLFEGSIADNIAYGRRYEPREKIIAAARAAYADEFVKELPQGYDSRLGEDGSGLSGGQRQRLCIARAILRDPAVLILDEATSQIDTDSEAKITRALQAFRHGRTTFIIAHRLSTVIDADRIVVMDAGRIVDEGTHADLLKRCAVYKTLTLTQLQPPAA